MMEGLPQGLIAYKRTPVFDQDSMPAGLRREHRTKPGVWAVIHVLEGQLAYLDLATGHTCLLTPEQPGLVRPEQPHEVAPIGPVRFYVEFHAAEASGGTPHQA